MPTKIRILLAIFFTTLFWVTVPSILLYANGYRYDFDKGQIIKTGSLLIDSTPRGALVTIDGQEKLPRWYDKFAFYKRALGLISRGGETPSLLDNLHPDTYQIKATKNEYHSWQKKVKVEPGLTTPVKNIQLFYENPVKEILDQGEIKQYFLSPRRDRIIYQIEQDGVDKFKFLVFSSGEIMELEALNRFEQLAGLVWSSRQEKIIFSQTPQQTNKNYFVFDLTSKKLVSLKDNFPVLSAQEKIKIDRAEKIQWEDEENVLFFQNKNSLFFLSSNQEEGQLLLQLEQGTIQDWLVQNQLIHLLLRQPDGLFLKKYGLKDKEIVTQVLVPNQDWKFLPSLQQPRINFLAINGQNQTLVIYQGEQNGEPEINKIQAKEIIPFANKNQYFFYNDYELWILRLTPFSSRAIQNIIINRFGQFPLIASRIHSSQDYLLYNANNSLWSLGVDEGQTHNLTNILSQINIDDFFVSAKYLYLLGEVEEQEGLWKVKIQ